MTGWRQAALPALAIALVCAVLGIQLAHDGGKFVTLKPTDPCASRTLDPQASGIDGLVERLVLIGLDDAACALGVSREAFVLQLGQGLSDTQLEAVRQGLLAAVAEMKADGTLPEASAFKEEILDVADLNGVLDAIARRLPDSVIDSALKTDDVLVRTINDLDLRAVLENLDDQRDLEAQVEEAVIEAAKDSLVQRVKDLLP